MHLAKLLPIPLQKADLGKPRHHGTRNHGRSWAVVARRGALQHRVGRHGATRDAAHYCNRSGAIRTGLRSYAHSGASRLNSLVAFKGHHMLSSSLYPIRNESSQIAPLSSIVAGIAEIQRARRRVNLSRDAKLFTMSPIGIRERCCRRLRYPAPKVQARRLFATHTSWVPASPLEPVSKPFLPKKPPGTFHRAPA